MNLQKSKVTERRQNSRIEVNWPVVILTDCGATVGETINIGVKGAFLHCPVPLPPKQKLKLFVMMPIRPPLNISAEVSWSNLYSSEMDDPPRGMGVRFTEISDASLKHLQTAIGLTAPRREKEH
ncbi:MAG: PilZ domain-containing protein [Syntrophobacteria bacterium]